MFGSRSYVPACGNVIAALGNDSVRPFLKFASAVQTLPVLVEVYDAAVEPTWIRFGPTFGPAWIRFGKSSRPESPR